MVKFGVHSALEVMTLGRSSPDTFSQIRLSTIDNSIRFFADPDSFTLTAATSPFGRIKTLIRNAREVTLQPPRAFALGHPGGRVCLPPPGTASACLPVRRGSSGPLALRCSTSNEGVPGQVGM